MYTLPKILIPLSLGLFVAKDFVVKDEVLLPVLVCSFVFAVISIFLSTRFNFANEYFAGIMIMSTVFVLGISLQMYDNRCFMRYETPLLTRNRSPVQLRVVAPPEKREKSWRMLCEVENAVFRQPQVYAYISRNSPYVPQYNNMISVKKELQKIEPPQSDGEFDYQKYCFNNNIGYSIYLFQNDYSIVDSMPAPTAMSIIYHIRDDLLGVVRRYSPDEQCYTIAAALLLGYDELADDTRQIFSTSGTIHILCVSGLHVATIFFCISFILSLIPFYWMKKTVAPLLSIILLWLYAAITGLSPSVVRAAIMLTMSTLGTVINVKTKIVNNICGSAFILMLCNPNIIFSVGAQMSYAAVAGIIVFQRHLSKIVEELLMGKKNILINLLKKIFDLMSVSIAVQLFIGPIILFYFNNFSSYFLLANIVAIPLATLSLYVGLLMLLLEIFVPWLNFLCAMAGKLFFLLIKLLVVMASFFDSLPMASIQNIEFDLIMLLLTFLLAITIKQCFMNKYSVSRMKNILYVLMMLLIYATLTWIRRSIIV